MVVDNEEDRERLQAMLDCLDEWSSDWQMLFKTDKCHVIHAGRNNAQYCYRWGGDKLEAASEEKDVGVIISKNLKPSLQCARAAMKANQVLGQMARAVSYRHKYTFIRLYKVYVRPHLQYCIPAWSPYTVADKEILENVQRRAVNMVSCIRGTYSEKLQQLGLSTLEENRKRGDMVEMYKLMTRKSRSDYRLFFQIAPQRSCAVNTRGNARTSSSQDRYQKFFLLP